MPTVSRFGRAWPTHVNVRGSREHGFLPNVSRFGRAWPTHVTCVALENIDFELNVPQFVRAWPKTKKGKITLLPKPYFSEFILEGFSPKPFRVEVES